ncbi:hypothetical protein LB572_06805 [Mesorhizobium sp. BH1-1-5]|uniref:hypothetical protein n=1 Tax=Mesorhizobium sp. BH1-1-5 TaxID=2876661 RepID=UPI001CCF68E2|nr:hypothetical protein [Mesorhizobium sp. BH1-1-5]MBZ9986802.1 hypothetical protein [Mesorhizobium sp. BH1-1-5]
MELMIALACFRVRSYLSANVWGSYASFQSPIGFIVRAYLLRLHQRGPARKVQRHAQLTEADAGRLPASDPGPPDLTADGNHDLQVAQPSFVDAILYCVEDVGKNMPRKLQAFDRSFLVLPIF